jgi:hypothetical protein
MTAATASIFTERTVMATAAVAQFPPRLPVSDLAQQLMASIDIMPLAFALFQQDQFERRIDRELQFYPAAGVKVITPEQRNALVDRAVIAMTLGEADKRALMDDMAAMAILRGVMRGVANGTIEKDSPLARFDLTTAKAVSKLAVQGALAYAARHPLGYATRSAAIPIGATVGAGIANHNQESVMPEDQEQTGSAAPPEETKPEEQKPSDQGDGASSDAPVEDESDR